VFGLPNTLLGLVATLAGIALAIGLIVELSRFARVILGWGAYVGILACLYSYRELGDRYFTEHLWPVTGACVVISFYALKRIPLWGPISLVAAIEFGSQINKSAYPGRVVVSMAVAAGFFIVRYLPRARARIKPPTARRISWPDLDRRGADRQRGSWPRRWGVALTRAWRKDRKGA
jgi:hypothetical protein